MLWALMGWFCVKATVEAFAQSIGTSAKIVVLSNRAPSRSSQLKAERTSLIVEMDGTMKVITSWALRCTGVNPSVAHPASSQPIGGSSC